KIIIPFIIDFNLTRAEEMLVGVCVPLSLLIAFEDWAYFNKFISPEYLIYKDTKAARSFVTHHLSDEEKVETARQNKFGLSVITFSLAFTSFLLIALGLYTEDNLTLLLIIAFTILALAYIPWRAS